MDGYDPEILAYALQLTDTEWDALEQELQEGADTTKAIHTDLDALFDEELARARRVYKAVA